MSEKMGSSKTTSILLFLFFHIGCSVHLPAIFTTSTGKPTDQDLHDYHQDYQVLDNQVIDAIESSADVPLKEKRLKEFKRFLIASARHEEDEQTLLLRPFARGFPTSEERLSAAEARALLFRGAPRGRAVPLSIDDLLADRCQMMPFEETVSHPGCENTTISANFCYGLCSSLFIPLQDDVIAMCQACAPTKFKTVAVDLHCPDKDSVRKHVKIVSSCACIPCESKGGMFG